MPPLYRVATTETFASESTLETVQEVELPNHGIGGYHGYADSPGFSSAYSTSPDTPSSLQTSFTFGEEPYHHTPIELRKGVAPADDWGYDLYHAESRQSESSSLRPKSVKSSKAFGFNRKKSISDITPGLAQLEPFKIKPVDPSILGTSVPLTLNQIDILTAQQLSKPIPPPPRQQIQHQSRLAALTKFGSGKEQVTGAVKLVIRSKDGEGPEDNEDTDSIFTTITTTSTSSSGTDIVPVYGRGGAGRAAGAKVMTQVYGGDALSIEEFSVCSGMTSFDDIPYDVGATRQRGVSSSSGKSGGKAFLGRMYGKMGNGSNTLQADTTNGPSNPRRSPSNLSGQNGDRSLLQEATASRESLATIHSCPRQATEGPKSYGRGGFARKPVTKEKEPKFEETEKHESRTGALLNKMRKSDKSTVPRELEEERKTIPAYGRGGAARKSKQP